MLPTVRPRVVRNEDGLTQSESPDGKGRHKSDPVVRMFDVTFCAQHLARLRGRITKFCCASLASSADYVQTTREERRHKSINMSTRKRRIFVAGPVARQTNALLLSRVKSATMTGGGGQKRCGQPNI